MSGYCNVRRYIFWLLACLVFDIEKFQIVCFVLARHACQDSRGGTKWENSTVLISYRCWVSVEHIIWLGLLYLFANRNRSFSHMTSIQGREFVKALTNQQPNLPANRCCPFALCGCCCHNSFQRTLDRYLLYARWSWVKEWGVALLLTHMHFLGLRSWTGMDKASRTESRPFATIWRAKVTVLLFKNVKNSSLSCTLAKVCPFFLPVYALI